MSEIAKLKLQVKQSKKRGSNKIVLELDRALALSDEITALEAKIVELSNIEPKHIVTPKEEFVREIQMQGKPFKEK